ncbi:MAG: homocysteine S-methyltransferase family protein [Verrucomicrobiota bacterium]
MSIAERARKQVLLSDGAWGTSLQSRGLKIGECPELWCLNRREETLEVARSYINAGSDMIQTNSFGATRFKLEHFDAADRVAEINEEAASISRKAAGPDHLVIASVGPTGKIVMMGEVTNEEVYDAFKDQVIALEKGGSDACCIETMADLEEARLAVRAAKENTKLEIIVTFTFEQTVRGDYRTMMGVSPRQMAEEMLRSGADIVGTNCGNGMERMAHIVDTMSPVAGQTPILVHANAGMPVNKGGVDVFPETPEQMAENAVPVLEAGARIIGGCCGTTPDHIRALRAMLDKR